MHGWHLNIMKPDRRSTDARFARGCLIVGLLLGAGSSLTTAGARHAPETGAFPAMARVIRVHPAGLRCPGHGYAAVGTAVEEEAAEEADLFNVPEGAPLCVEIDSGGRRLLADPVVAQAMHVGDPLYRLFSVYRT